MKRNLIATSSLLVSFLFTATGAFAQTAVRANVPFAFTVGTKQLPPGTYTIRMEDQQSTICVANVKTGAAMFAHVQRQYPGKKSDKLVFQHHGYQYALTQIWGDRGATGMTLRAQKVEQQVEIAGGPSKATSEEVEIAAK